MMERSAFVSVVQNEELQISCQVDGHATVLQEAEVRSGSSRTVGM
jgi:hypothetical protein